MPAPSKAHQYVLLRLLFLSAVFVSFGSALASTECDQPGYLSAEAYNLDNQISTMFLHVSTTQSLPGSENDLDSIPQPDPGNGGSGCNRGTWIESRTVRCWKANLWWYATASCASGVAYFSARTRSGVVAAVGTAGCAVASIWSEDGWTTCRETKECQWAARYNNNRWNCVKLCSGWL